MRLVRWYVTIGDLFLFVSAVILVLAIFFQWDIYVFDRTALLTLAILVLFARGLISTASQDVFYFLVLTSIVLTVFFPMLQIIFFFIIALTILKLIKLI